MGGREVTHARTMPRELVHRASIHEVLLTDALEVEDGQYMFGVQWPRHHVITGPGSAISLDDALLIEAVRQIGLAGAHLFCGVPLDAHFIARSIGFDWITAPPAFAFAPLNGVASVAFELRRRNDIALIVHFTVDGVIVARGEGHLQWVTSEVFTRLRGPGGARSDELVEPPAPASLFAELVGRRDQTQILVEPDEPRTGRLRLRLDPTHTTYFDHPQDHLPANLAAEAVRQAALLHHPEGQVLGVRLAFHRFADLDRPILLTSVVEQGRVQVELRQECTVAASGSVALGAHEGLLEVPAGRHH